MENLVPVFSFETGEIFLVNKPYRWTSFDVVRKIRAASKIKKLKVGHAGTLDPLASGLLIICTGKLTKQIDTFQAEEKEYTGKMILGATTPSYDMEQEVDERYDIGGLTEELIRENTKKFLGNIEQYPPAHSAVRVGGERLYEKARRGEEIELKARPVEIKEFEITAINLPEVSFRVVCSKGTYIRSLVHDFGKALQNGAYLSELVRTRSGSFTLKNAWELSDLIAKIRSDKMSENQ